MNCAGCGATRTYDSMKLGYGDVAFGEHRMAFVGDVTIRFGECGVCGKSWKSAEINIRDMTPEERAALCEHAGGVPFDQVVNPDHTLQAQITVEEPCLESRERS